MWSVNFSPRTASNQAFSLSSARGHRHEMVHSTEKKPNLHISKIMIFWKRFWNYELFLISFIVKEIKIDYSAKGVRIFSDILSPIWPWISFVLQNLGILINIPKFCIVKIFPYKIWGYWSISPDFDSKNISIQILGILINIPRFW